LGRETKENDDYSARLSELETRKIIIKDSLDHMSHDDSQRQTLVDELANVSNELKSLHELRLSTRELDNNRRSTGLNVIITPQNEAEYEGLRYFSLKYKDTNYNVRNPIRFRGIVDSINYGTPNDGTPRISITPAILKPGANPFADPEKPVLGIKMDMRPEQRGVIVVGVTDGSPAATAGLKVADIIVALDGNKIENSHNFLQLITKRNAGDRVKLDFLRDNTAHSATATLIRLNELLELERRQQKLGGQ
jgi:hypothetical protein